MKKFWKVFGITVFFWVIGMYFIGCDMNSTGYKVEYYSITYATYMKSETFSSNEEALEYVKKASGTGDRHTYWCGGKRAERLRSFFKDKGHFSDDFIDKIVQGIDENETFAVWSAPDLFVFDDCRFFYIKNNNYN